MGFAPQFAGPHDPVIAITTRHPGWVRRTTTIDTTRPEGFQGPALVDARARDLYTSADGTAVVLAEASFTARHGFPGNTLLDITASGGADLDDLVGVGIAGGFRAKAAASLASRADTVDEGTWGLLNQLLDDLAGATLVAGYAGQYAATVAETRADEPDREPNDDGDRPKAGTAGAQMMIAQGDLCAGWGNDAVLMTNLRATGVIMTPLGPAAPPIADPDDPDAWHFMGALTPNGMRRLRRLDLGPSEADGSCALEVHFRDGHVDEHGLERCLHEYLIRGRVDPETETITEIRTTAHVLPWQECPGAVGSAQRLIGRPLAGLRPMVRTEFTGATTCTHLNDTLRSLQDIPLLLRSRARSSD